MIVCDQGQDCMGANRIEAFSDGVIAVIITIMVLESLAHFPCVPLCPLWLRSWPAAKRSTRSGPTAANEVKSCSPTTTGAASIIAASSSGNG